ncbi:TIGR03862 family flavoprotein [Sulfitobacter pontiacus]|uniref:TIGR03862 family flavoprotein n=1 Tax=Sulfitobacter pontiacus TaxID=60137 RepID=UPI000447C9AB|nr:TIGR03862 family flavoprotein [Sulfitobacter pontiacus]KAJ30195.1 NAD(FAD)-utilizing dehydrogenase [Sulfitobacter pontiacus 3SOLIMAR09]
MTSENLPARRGVVIGAGPAGLMAAEMMAAAGLAVTVCDHKPSVGRKLLMAGKSGLNITKAEEHAKFLNAFSTAKEPLEPILNSFDATAVQEWAKGLGQTLFTGSTGRVFPTVMKASPLLRAWLARLADAGVAVNTRWRWTGWEDGAPVFDMPDGMKGLPTDVTVLAMGGASWSRLGSTGAWALPLRDAGVDIARFAPANAGIAMNWSPHMEAHFGAALKGIGLKSGTYRSRGEAVISARGLEGGGIYTVSRGLREGHPLMLDLLPDQSREALVEKLAKPRGKMSVANYLRKTLKLDVAKIALLQEMARPLPANATDLARLLKALPVKHAGLRPLDEAISTAGGVKLDALDDGLMLHARPGVFVAGEMLDWEAPTGGYLISACLATGRWAGQHAAAWAQRD